MIVAAPTRQDRVTIGGGSETLAQITRPHVHLAIWRRALPEALAALAAQDMSVTDDIDTRVRVSEAGPAVGALLAKAGYRRLPDAVAELAKLIAVFAGIMRCGAVRMRMEVIETDACRRFHADNVTARLILTLAGRSTQWIDADEPERVSQLGPGDVALFKGRLWAETPAILHRSPPIAGTGESRLLLVDDPVAH